MMITKTVEENKYALDCQFKPKLLNANRKLTAMDQQLKDEIHQRDNQKEISNLQTQIDSYVDTYQKL